MLVEVEVVGVLVVEVLATDVDVPVIDVPVLVVPPPEAADWPVLVLPSPAPPVPPTPTAAPVPAPAPPPAPAGTNGRKTTGRELGDVCATAGSRYGRSTGTAGIGVNDFTVTGGGAVLRVVEVAVDPGASVEGGGEVRVTVAVVCDGIRPPSAYAPTNRTAHKTAMASSVRKGSDAPGEPVDPAPRADVPAITKSSWLPAVAFDHSFALD